MIQHQVARIFDQHQIDQICLEIHKMQWIELGQNHSLYNITRCETHSNRRIADILRQAICNSFDLDIRSHYGLQYRENSFATPHRDEYGGVTFVTKLRETNMKGGHSLVWDGFNDKRVFSVDFNVGETLYFPGKLKHGVTFVESGLREVLVVWASDKPKDEEDVDS